MAELKTKLDKGTYVRAHGSRRWASMRRSGSPVVSAADKGLKATTVAGYERYVADDITPSALGGMRLTDIRRYHVAAFAADLTKAGRGAVTVRRI